MKNTLCAISSITGFLISVYASLIGERSLLWLSLALIFVVPIALALWGDTPDG